MHLHVRALRHSAPGPSQPDECELYIREGHLKKRPGAAGVLGAAWSAV